MKKEHKTIVLGASTNPGRYSYKAVHSLLSHGYPVIPVGIKKGEVAGHPIEAAETIHQNIDTLTLYVGAQNQPVYYSYIMDTHPKRIIFNPGTENPELEEMAREKGIEVLQACTLVLLATGQY